MKLDMAKMVKKAVSIPETAYLARAKRYGMSEAEALAAVRNLERRGLVERIGDGYIDNVTSFAIEVDCHD